jgi:hypothetical protein
MQLSFAQSLLWQFNWEKEETVNELSFGLDMPYQISSSFWL